MEVAAEKQKLESKITFYRTGWFLFMVLVFGPAWYLASTVEGVSFSSSLDIISEGLGDLYFPSFLVSLLKYPITILATLIPGSSAFVFIVLALFFSYGSFFIAFLYFAFVQPPNFNEMKTKLDPEWRIKENAKWIVKPLARPVTFAGFIVFLVLTTVLGEIFYGFYRNPIADNFTGTVYLVDRSNKKIPIDVSIKLDIIDPGMVYDRKPGVRERSMKIEFSGKGLKTLKDLGIDEKLFAGGSENARYGSRVCGADSGTTAKNPSGFYRGTWLLRSYNFKNKPTEWETVRCPEKMHFGMETYDTAQFAISEIAKGHIVYAELKRDSRFSFLQGMILKNRYENNKNNFFDPDL